MKQISIVLLMFVFLITGVSVQAQSPVQVNQIQEKPHKLQPQLDKVNLKIEKLYKYMEAKYPGHGVISGKNAKLFDTWDKEDPIDNQECMRVKIIGTSSEIWGVCK